MQACGGCRCRYLLPPIIFYAGLSVKKKQFFRNFLTISSFGIIGTYVAFATIALVLYGLSKLPNFLKLSVRPYLLQTACLESESKELTGASCVAAAALYARVKKLADIPFMIEQSLKLRQAQFWAYGETHDRLPA